MTTLSIGTSTAPTVRDTQTAWLRLREEALRGLPRRDDASPAPDGTIDPVITARPVRPAL
ncbi:hypothetical protein [Actinoplanes utahensis]|uniref:Uncharacterized protein n=1 Tax=Actinoplanes utahensis TaxID=1869 RepID=A0A0A6X9E1_ACTUT|nr:hypothetical protein [Actinoplanes utahensis]KHD76732.1 hypothetical protein MB27_15725 [Actinoplanes utahensis]GIF33205.1 hypothetical protein Aut01nite_61910 [Actinoplanes utahensis]